MYELRHRLLFTLRLGLFNKLRIIREIAKVGRDTIFNTVKKCFGELFDPLKFKIDLTQEKKIFPDDLKIARFQPVFIAGDRSKLGNYRPISVLPCLKYLSV